MAEVTTEINTGPLWSNLLSTNKQKQQESTDSENMLLAIIKGTRTRYSYDEQLTRG